MSDEKKAFCLSLITHHLSLITFVFLLLVTCHSSLVTVFLTLGRGGVSILDALFKAETVAGCAALLAGGNPRRHRLIE
jgi:hypothetical protein